MYKRPLIAALAATLAACSTVKNQMADNVTSADVLDTYGDVAEATYADSLSTAKVLQTKVNALLASPTEANLDAARTAWLASRVPYQQTEAYRFGNAIVDDWEGKVNAWPLDEGLIDYVDTSSYGTESDENPLHNSNVIAAKNIRVNGDVIDASSITPDVLEQLHEAGDVEANVATGYHAIEFLLWGQDLNGTEKGAGERPATDFSTSACTGGNCDRRRDYLAAATTLLISDLQEMADAWKDGGAARKELAAKGEKGGLATILTGMGSLSYGELAGERIKLGLMLHDPEEEHDCFSDNTHNSHYYDAKSIRNVYLGEYRRVDGSVVRGSSISALVRKKDPVLDAKLQAQLLATEKAMSVMVSEAKRGNTFDVLIGAKNKAGNMVVQGVVDALVTQTKSIEDAIEVLGLSGIELEGSDSLDNPDAVL